MLTQGHKMEYELIPIEAKAAGKSHVLMGTIVDTRRDIKTFSQGNDKWAIKADVELDGYGLVEDIPVFYHCQFSKTAGRAAFEEGNADDLITEGSPFIKDDRVVVLNDGEGEGEGEGLSAENLKIVAYEDGLPRQCVFQFRITRDDGEIIDESLLLHILIYLSTDGGKELVGGTLGYHPDLYPDEEEFWVKEGDTWHYSRDEYSGSYNTVTQIWTVPFIPGYDEKAKHGKDFWAEFDCEKSVDCLYADREVDSRGYIYVLDDFYQESQKIVSKFYEIVVPYYERLPLYVTPHPGCCGCEPSGYTFCWAGGGGYVKTIKSSIPYTVRFEAPRGTSSYPTGIYYGVWIESCRGYSCPACLDRAIKLGARFCNEDPAGVAIDESEKVTAACSDGTVSSNLKTNKVYKEQIITPPENTVQTDAHAITLSRQGGGYTLRRVCRGGNIQEFDLGFRCFVLSITILHTPNIKKVLDKYADFIA